MRVLLLAWCCANVLALSIPPRVVLFTSDLRVHDHGGLAAVAASGASSWAAVLAAPSLKAPGLARAALELAAELEQRYGARLAVVEGTASSVACAIQKATADVTIHVCDDPASPVPEGCEAWSTPARAAHRDATCDSFERYVASLREELLPVLPPPNALPSSSGALWTLLPHAMSAVDAFAEDSEGHAAGGGSGTTAPWGRVSAQLCGCATAAAALEDYTTLGREGFAARYLTGRVLADGESASLYAASLQWVVGNLDAASNPTTRLATREVAERAFSLALAHGSLSRRQTLAARFRGFTRQELDFEDSTLRFPTLRLSRDA